MLHKTKGIVLHHIKYGDTSIICKILTQDKGLQSFIINGVRTTKSRMNNSLFQHLQPLDIVFYFKENRSLQRIKEAYPNPVITKIPNSISKSTTAIFIAEILYRSLPEDIFNEQIFEFVYGDILTLENSGNQNDFVFYFLLNLSEILGFQPQNEGKNKRYFDMREGVFCDSKPDYADIIEGPATSFLNALLQKESTLHFNEKVKNFLLNKLIEYYRIHLKDFQSIRSVALLNPEYFD